MDRFEYDYLFKILIVGDSGVGKSALLKRFVDDVYSGSFISTIGVDFSCKTIKLNDKKAKLQIWDTAGQERFRTITSSYYRGAQGVFITFDLTDMDSFINVESWLKEVKNYATEKTIIHLVGTKLDRVKDRKVSFEKASAFAIINNLEYIETSAKNPLINDANLVEKAFIDLTIKLMDSYKNVLFKNIQPTPKISSSFDEIKRNNCCS